MPIHGTIEEAGLPDVLQLLSLGRKSGCLQVEDGATHGEVFLEVGRVIYAAVANRIDRLGEILVKAGRITREQLNDAAQEQSRRSSKRQLGRILVDSGRIDRTELERYVRLQVEEAVYLLFTWKRGTFTFTTDRRPTNQPLLVSLDCEGLLLEGARRVDEWSLIEKKIPSFDLVYRRTKARLSGDVAEDLSDDQQRILPMLDGTRDVAGIVDVTGMSEFDVGKALYGLIMAGFAQLVERRSQIRHLDFRELLAYVVREAEYADPERRRSAARHIVDCPACTERLRTIHVRRTTGTLLDAMGEPTETSTETAIPAVAAPPAAATPAAPPPVAPVAPAAPKAAAPKAAAPKAAAPLPPTRIERRAPSPVTPAAPPVTTSVPPRPSVPPAHQVPLPPAVPAPAAPPQLPERRARDRRACLERRMRDRRAGADRRTADRRRGVDRRHVVSATWTETQPERRSGPRREADRRSGNGDRRAVASAGMGMINRRSGPGAERMTESRIVVPERHEPEVTPWAAEAAEQATMVGNPPDASREDTIEIVPIAVETNEYPVPPAEEPPRPAPRTSPITSETKPRPTQDLVWLQSPEETMDHIRASRASLRAADLPPIAPIASPAPVEPPAPAPAAPAPMPPPPPPARPLRPPVAAPGPIVVRRSPERSPDGGGVVKFEIKASTLRRAAIAAGIGAVALLSYSAGRRGGNAPAGQLPESTVVAAAPAEPARPVVARPEQPRPVTPPATAAAPPPSRTPAPAPAQAQRAPPMTVTTPAAAQTPPRAAVPAPVAAAPAPSVAQPAPATAQPPVAVATPAPAPPPETAPARPAPTAAEPDRELAAGGWTSVSRADATTALGGTLGAIEGLAIESITQSTSGTRVRVRLTQLTDAGQRITLTQTRAGAAVRSGPARVTALRVMPPSEAFPYSTGTASLGNILITARSSISADELRGHLDRLGEAR